MDSNAIEIKGRKVVLIGGAGFIGHNLALELKRRGAEVSVIDGLEVNNLLSLYSANYAGQERDLYIHIVQSRLKLLQEAGVPLYVEDVRDYFRLSNVLDKIKPQVVVLLAAISHAGKSNKDPYSTFDHSFRTLENALDNARGRAEQFIYFSSSMVYGNFETDTVNEESPCNPLGIYGALKFGGEKLVIAYNQVFGLPYTIIRPSALYGERCISRRVGQIFIENALRGQDITIKGDGEECLDFTYIGDMVHGICQAITRPEARNEIFNMTYGQGRSLNSMAAMVQKHFPGISIKHIQRDALVPERGTLSVDKAKRLIGYNPSNPLEVGYEHYIQWYKKLFAELQPKARGLASQLND
ncbi:NAD-dependent epimerase/dehydratase family protein [Humidesulfovibrio idahonensis]